MIQVLYETMLLEVHKKSGFFKHTLYLYIKHNDAKNEYSEINTFL